MKNITSLLCFLVCSLSFAQIKVSDTEKLDLVGEYKLLGTSYAKIEKKEDLHIFTYRDEKYETVNNYKSFYFRDSDLDTLYDLFANMDDKEEGAEKTVDLENGDKLFFTYKKSFGKMYASVIHIDKAGVGGAIRWLTEKQYKKLFGKA